MQARSIHGKSTQELQKAALGPLVTSENEGLHELWNVPMAGFFTYGEYGRARDRNLEFHSGACCWVALKEKSLQNVLTN